MAKFSFLVGKVDMKTLYSMDIEEFMLALGENDLVERIKESFASDAPLPAALHEAAMHLYRQYLVIGRICNAVCGYQGLYSGATYSGYYSCRLPQ